MHVMVARVWASANLRGSGSGCGEALVVLGPEVFGLVFRICSPSPFLFLFFPLFPLLSPFSFLQWSMLSGLDVELRMRVIKRRVTLVDEVL